ncbi:dihydroorotate dehydrogenase 2 [Actinomycetota bacterium]|nr:dihydroorotate dehydrogenase 2 [Actinomycetota bacterium]
MREFLQWCASWAYKYFFKPLMFRFSTADGAHTNMIKFSKWAGNNGFFAWFIKYSMKFESPMLSLELDRFGGLEFKNPLGLGAGFDKNAVTAKVMERLGFGYAAFGSATARECPGNPRPWFHRLPDAKSMMVYVGLANEGIEGVAKVVGAAYDESKTLKVGQSIARTNDSLAADVKEGIQDYVTSLKELAGRTAFVEVNISCPNTFKGEPYTTPERLDNLLKELDKVKHPQPITLKMPSDKTWKEFKKLLDVAVKHNVQGVTIANLRKDRENIVNLDGTPANIPDEWKGNMSGAPTAGISDELIARTYLEYGDKLTIMGLGGVFTAQDAYRKIKLGADTVSFVSALMFEGPAVVPNIKRKLVQLLRQDGYTNVSQARGVDAKVYLASLEK